MTLELLWFLVSSFFLSAHSLNWAQWRSDFSHLAPSPDQSQAQAEASDWSVTSHADLWLVRTHQLKWQTAVESWSPGWHLKHFKPSASHIPSLFTRGQKSHSSLIEVVKNPDLSDLYIWHCRPLHFNTTEQRGMACDDIKLLCTMSV